MNKEVCSVCGTKRLVRAEALDAWLVVSLRFQPPPLGRKMVQPRTGVRNLLLFRLLSRGMSNCRPRD